MSSLNRAQLLGNVGADPDIRVSGNGRSVANIRVATTNVWNDKDTGQRKEHTEWHRAVFFGRDAEFIRDYVIKGRQVYLEGEIRTEKYTDSNGQDAYTTKIYGTMIRATGAASTNAPKPSERPAPAGTTANSAAGRTTTSRSSTRPAAPASENNPFEDDTIPF